MTLEEYILKQLEAGEEIDDIMKQFADAGNSAMKRHEEKLKASAVKAYDKPISLDADLAKKIRDNALTADLVADVFLYYVGSNNDSFMSGDTEHIPALKKTLTEAFEGFSQAVVRISKVLSDNTLSKRDKERILLYDMLSF